VNSFEVGCTTPDNLTNEAYRGKDTSYTVTGLLPGRSYLFQIRAYNRIGAGLWSDPLEVISGAGSPDAPLEPKVTPKSSHSVLVSWTEPLNNGSAVTEYKLQMAALISQTPELPPPPSSSSPPPSPSSASGENSARESLEEGMMIGGSGDGEMVPSETEKELTRTQEESVSTFSQVYLGPHTSCEVKALQPASVYLFRLQVRRWKNYYVFHCSN